MRIFIALTLCVTFVCAQNSDTACVEEVNGRLVAVPGDNTKFYHCDNCIGILKSCPGNTIFSAVNQACIWADAGCGGAGSGGGCGSTSAPVTGTPPTQTPPTTQTTSPATESPTTDCVDLCPQGQYRPHEDSDKYIVCANGIDYVMSCPCGLIWDNKLQTCNRADNGCGGSGGSTSAPGTTIPPTATPPPATGSPTTDCPDLCPQGQYRPHEDSDKYIVCANGIDYVMSCPCGLIWDNKLVTCNGVNNGCGGSGSGCGSGSGSCA